MNDTVTIKIKSRQKNYADASAGGPAEETICSSSKGKLDHRGGKLYLRYEEQIEENAAPVSSTLKLFDGKLQLSRKGTVKTTMLFEAGQEHKTGYITPYGTFAFTVRTRSLSCTEDESHFRAAVEYELDLDDALFAVCSLEIDARKV